MKTMSSYLKKEVVLLGAQTKFGRMTSFLLKQCPTLNKLTLYDDKNIKFCNDIEYINKGCNVKFCNGKEKLSEAVKTGDIIIIGDDDEKEATPESTLFTRAPIISDYLRYIACYNSNAIILVATTPVNMVLPFVAETLKNLGHWNERKLFGLTNIENMKARCILAAHLQINPRTIYFPVIGGSSSETRVPLLSKMCPNIQLNKQDLKRITCSVKTSEIKLYKGKECQESLNRAYATSILVQSIVSALNGKEVVETVLSYQNTIKDSDYFSLPVILGKEGIKDHISFSNISPYEKFLLSHAIKCMAADAKIAKKYSEKIRKNTTNIIPPNKLSSLQKENIESLNKVTTNNNNNNAKDICSLCSSSNLESKVQTQQTKKPLESTQSKLNLLFPSKNSPNNDLAISKSTKKKNVLLEDKLTACRNEDINLTPGVSIPSGSKSKSFKVLKFVEMQRPSNFFIASHSNIKYASKDNEGEKFYVDNNDMKKQRSIVNNKPIIPKHLNNGLSMMLSSRIKLPKTSTATNTNNTIYNEWKSVNLQAQDTISSKDLFNTKLSQYFSKNIWDKQESTSSNSNVKNAAKLFQKKKISLDNKHMKKQFFDIIAEKKSLLSPESYEPLSFSLSSINKFPENSKDKNINHIKIYNKSKDAYKKKLGDITSYGSLDPKKYVSKSISDNIQVTCSNPDIKNLKKEHQEKMLPTDNNNTKKQNNVVKSKSVVSQELENLLPVILSSVNNLNEDFIRNKFSEVTDTEIVDQKILKDITSNDFLVPKISGYKLKNIAETHEFTGSNSDKNEAKDLHEKRISINNKHTKEQDIENKFMMSQDFDNRVSLTLSCINNLTENSSTKDVSEVIDAKLFSGSKDVDKQILEDSISNDLFIPKISGYGSKNIPGTHKFTASNSDTKNEAKDLQEKKLSNDNKDIKQDVVENKSTILQDFDNRVSSTLLSIDKLTENSMNKGISEISDTKICNAAKDVDKQILEDIPSKDSFVPKISANESKNISDTAPFTASNSNKNNDTKDLQERKLSIDIKGMKQQDVTENKYISQDIDNRVSLTLSSINKLTENSMTEGIFEVGYSKICNVSKDVDMQIPEDITSHNFENNSIDSKPTCSIPKNISAIHEFSVPDSEMNDDVIIEVKKYCDVIKNKSLKPVGKNKDLIYPLSVNLPPINKLSGNKSTNSISTDTTNPVNSGLNNFKIIKRHHKQAPYYRKKLDSQNLFEISSTQSSKKPIGLSSAVVISLYRAEASHPAKNDLRSNNSKSILSKAADIGCLKKLKPNMHGTFNRHMEPNGDATNTFQKNKSNFSQIQKKNIGTKTKQILISQLHPINGPCPSSYRFDKILDKGLFQSYTKINTVADQKIEDNSNVKIDITSKKNNGNLKLFVENCNEETTKSAVKVPLSTNKGLKEKKMNDYNTVHSENSLKMNKFRLILHEKLFKSHKFNHSNPPVMAWSRYASSKSHCNQVINSKINNVCCKDQIQLNLKPQNNAKSKQKSTGLSIQEDIHGQPESPRETFHKPINTSRRSNVYREKPFMNTVQTLDNFIRENVLQKQRNSISSAIKQSSFKDQDSEEDSFSEVNKKYFLKYLKQKRKIKNEKSNDLQKIHLLKGNSATSSTVIAYSEPTIENDNWRKKYFKKANNSTKMNSNRTSKAISKESKQATAKNVTGYQTELTEKQSNLKNKHDKVSNVNKCNASIGGGLSTSSETGFTSEPFINKIRKQMSSIQESKMIQKWPSVGSNQDSYISLKCQPHHSGFNSPKDILDTKTVKHADNDRVSTETYDASVDQSENCGVKN